MLVLSRLQILVFNLPVNLAQGTSVLYAYILGLPAAPLTALQVRSFEYQ